MRAGDIYKEAIQIEGCGPEQRRVFNWWKKHNADPVTEVLAWDTETNGLSFGLPYPLYITEECFDETKDIFPFGFSMCIPYKDTLAFLWARHLDQKFYREVLKLLRVPGQKVGHNIRYDLRVCAVNDIFVAGENHCTMTMARIHWNRRNEFDLKTLTKVVAEDLYGYEDSLKAIHRNIKSSYTRAGYPKGFANYSFLPEDIISKYAKMDVFVTWLLNFHLRNDINKYHKEVYAREKTIITVVKDLEFNGMYFDADEAEKETRNVEKLIPKIEARLYKRAGKRFNYRSWQQLQKICIGQLKLTKKDLWDSKKKKLTTGKEQLLKCCTKYHTNKRLRSFVDTLLELRAYNKIIGTYLKPLAHKARYNNGFVYFNLNPTDTVTGRMTSNDPSLHTMPKPVDKDNVEKKNPVRHCFICPPGQTMFFIDYSQMEMWLFAILAKELTMLETLLAGGDIHASVAYRIYGDKAINKKTGEKRIVWIDGDIYELYIDKQMRFKCKAVNFGIIYGMGFKQLAIQIKSSEVEAYDLRQQYLETYPRIEEHNLEIASSLRNQGYIMDPFGKRYNLKPSEAYKGINAEVQGACAQIMKIALINIYNYFGLFSIATRPKLRLVIHDEVVFSLYNKMKKYWPAIIYNVEYYMSHIPQLMSQNIILNVDGNITTTTWEEKHKYDKWLQQGINRLERKYNGLPTEKAQSVIDVKAYNIN